MSVQEEIHELEPWYHNLHLPDGTQTAPEHDLGNFPAYKWEKIKSAIPEDLSGWKALDIGCNAGFYSIELAKRGAKVTGIDLDEHYLKQARWVAGKYGLSDRICFREMQVYDLAHENEKYDLVWFMGVFYHLRYPVLAMDIVSRITRKMLVFQTLSMSGEEKLEIAENIDFDDREVFHQRAWPKMAFVENRMANDPTNWWIPNNQCIISLLRSCGLKIESRPLHETYVAVVDAGKRSRPDNWNYSEYLAAIGKEWKSEVAGKILEKNNSRKESF